MYQKTTAVAAAEASLPSAAIAPDVIRRPGKRVFSVPLVIMAMSLILWPVWIGAECDVVVVVLLDRLGVDAAAFVCTVKDIFLLR